MLRSEAGRNPHDRALVELIGELSTGSDVFRTRWAAHDVQFHRVGSKKVHHPVVGDLELGFEALELPSDPGLTMLVYTAAGTSFSDAPKVLASWAATQDQATRDPATRQAATTQQPRTLCGRRVAPLREAPDRSSGRAPAATWRCGHRPSCVRRKDTSTAAGDGHRGHDPPTTSAQRYRRRFRTRSGDAQVTRFVVDAGVVLDLVSAGPEVHSGHQLLAPTLLRSQTLSLLHEAVQRGELPADLARDRLARVGRLPIRLLGDGALRRRAWQVADRLGWASTYDAEYVALTELQADAFVTLDEELARRLDGIVTIATIDDLRRLP